LGQAAKYCDQVLTEEPKSKHRTGAPPPFWLKIGPFLISFVGGIFLLIGFGDLSGASLPYQDATPELLDVQRGQMAKASTVALAGGLILFGGVAWAILRRRSRSVNP
jgi:hypothetical protein